MRGPSFRAAPVRVRVPATSANLGPGFDAFGLALALYDDVIAAVTDSGLVVEVAGEGADDVHRNERNLVVKAMRATFDALGGQPRGLHVVCANRIPHARGLGSSAAAVLAGVTAARALVLGGLDDSAALAVATAVEGHPDNVAACMHGGFTIAWREGERTDLARLRVHPDVRAVAFVPATRSSTTKARKALPEQVPHSDAAHSAGRAALLVHALTTDPRLLLPATEDRLHQQYRAGAAPRTADLVAKLRARSIAAMVSGSGPTVLALVVGDAEAERVATMGPKSFEAMVLPVDVEGAVVLPVA